MTHYITMLVILPSVPKQSNESAVPMFASGGWREDSRVLYSEELLCSSTFELRLWHFHRVNDAATILIQLNGVLPS
ncbi:hypothetical protein VFPPC_16509 [Pochonia chlamydosporia 170]|uniref:Uncharacterized protein n=1 Tax=Pochonia chlamydosporia 170 TaxID=1380566 RepID=A0A179F7V6_METCM|nr:hypothetical protein VFPPC_16509 [Pochonia chlamydosporia 170]OAQ61420.1 hypothetical protein VFPPC_16509 [Pochonia chlamydosporia 170]